MSHIGCKHLDYEMMKQRYCYIITDPDGKEIRWSLHLNRKMCIKLFVENYSTLNPKKWKYWYRRNYRAKKIPLEWVEERPGLKTMIVYYDKSLEAAIKNMAILYSMEAYIIGEEWKWEWLNNLEWDENKRKLVLKKL